MPDLSGLIYGFGNATRRTRNRRRQQPMFKPAAGLALALAMAFPATAGSRISRGEALVRANCARCHAVGRTDQSHHPDAPPFRTLSQRYPLRDLEEALAEGISTGHPDMPEFIADPDQIEAMLAYIGSLKRK
jgi:mono/diheme cytochrome c family protein